VTTYRGESKKKIGKKGQEGRKGSIAIRNGKPRGNKKEKKRSPVNPELSQQSDSEA